MQCLYLHCIALQVSSAAAPISQLPTALLARLMSHSKLRTRLTVLPFVNHQFYTAATQHNIAYADIRTIHTKQATLKVNGHGFRAGATAQQRKRRMISLCRFLLHRTERLRVLDLSGKGCSVARFFREAVLDGVAYKYSCRRPFDDAQLESVRTFKVHY